MAGAKTSALPASANASAREREATIGGVCRDDSLEFGERARRIVACECKLGLPQRHVDGVRGVWRDAGEPEFGASYVALGEIEIAERQQGVAARFAPRSRDAQGPQVSLPHVGGRPREAPPRRAETGPDLGPRRDACHELVEGSE